MPASTAFGVTVTYTPPPPTQTGMVTMAVRDCTITAASSGPPDATGGWGVQFRRNLLGFTTLTNIGSRDTTAPYQQVSGSVVPATYVVTGLWTKTGAVSVTQVIGQKVCGGTLP